MDVTPRPVAQPFETALIVLDYLRSNGFRDSASAFQREAQSLLARVGGSLPSERKPLATILSEFLRLKQAEASRKLLLSHSKQLGPQVQQTFRRLQDLLFDFELCKSAQLSAGNRPVSDPLPGPARLQQHQTVQPDSEPSARLQQQTHQRQQVRGSAAMSNAEYSDDLPTFSPFSPRNYPLNESVSERLHRVAGTIPANASRDADGIGLGLGLSGDMDGVPSRAVSGSAGAGVSNTGAIIDGGVGAGAGAGAGAGTGVSSGDVSTAGAGAGAGSVGGDGDQPSLLAGGAHLLELSGGSRGRRQPVGSRSPLTSRSRKRRKPMSPNPSRILPSGYGGRGGPQRYSGVGVLSQPNFDLMDETSRPSLGVFDPGPDSIPLSAREDSLFPKHGFGFVNEDILHMLEQPIVAQALAEHINRALQPSESEDGRGRDDLNAESTNPLDLRRGHEGGGSQSGGLEVGEEEGVFGNHGSGLVDDTAHEPAGHGSLPLESSWRFTTSLTPEAVGGIVDAFLPPSRGSVDPPPSASSSSQVAPEGAVPSTRAHSMDRPQAAEAKAAASFSVAENAETVGADSNPAATSPPRSGLHATEVAIEAPSGLAAALAHSLPVSASESVPRAASGSLAAAAASAALELFPASTPTGGPSSVPSSHSLPRVSSQAASPLPSSLSVPAATTASAAALTAAHADIPGATDAQSANQSEAAAPSQEAELLRTVDLDAILDSIDYDQEDEDEDDDDDDED